MGIYGLVGIFEILSAQSDCTFKPDFIYLGEGFGFRFSYIFSHPSFTGLFVVHLIADRKSVV